MCKKMLYVIDLQKGMLNSESEKRVTPITQFLKENREKGMFDFVAASAYINHALTPCYRDGWKECMDEGSKSFVFDASNLVDKVFNKYTYSSVNAAVYDYLRSNNIKQVYLCGISTNCCVLATAFELYDAGYEVFLIEDLSKASTKENHEAGVLTFASCMGEDRVVKSKDIVEEFEKINEMER